MMKAALNAASLLKPAAILILASALAPCFAPAVAQSPSDFRMAAGTPTEAPAAFEFESDGFSYRVAPNGNGRRTKGDKTRRYNLHLGGGASIRRLYFTEYGDDLLLLCEVDGGEDGPSVFITRLEQPSMRALWKQSAPSDSVVTLRRGSSLYLGGAGFVARLELNNGAYAWQHRDRREDADEEGEGREGDDRARDRDDRENDKESEALIPPGRYVPAEAAGDTVVFKPAGGPAVQGAKTVRVSRKTGRIISVE